MTATERVITYLGEHGPAPTSEIVQALSDQYGVRTVQRTVADLKRKGAVVDTGERRKTATKPEHIIALDRELERARKAEFVRNTLLEYSGMGYYPSKPKKPNFIQRVKRWFGVK